MGTLKKLSNRRIAFLVESETLEVAMHEKVSSKDIEDPELAELWRKASVLFDELKPIRAEIFKILIAAESEG